MPSRCFADDKPPKRVARLEEVQRLAPNLPHTWFNLGIYYKKAGEVQKATGEFERMVSLVPGEPIAHHQLGALCRDAGRLADARSQFERAAELDPLLAAPHFQLCILYRQNGNSEAAARQLVPETSCNWLGMASKLLRRSVPSEPRNHEPVVPMGLSSEDPVRTLRETTARPSAAGNGRGASSRS